MPDLGVYCKPTKEDIPKEKRMHQKESDRIKTLVLTQSLCKPFILF